jgi:hypothetical protein
MLAVLAGLLLPPVAAGDSGSITNVSALGNDRVAATFSVTWTTCTPEPFGETDCSWYPWAGELVASKPCPSSGVSIDLSHVWSGDAWSGSGTQTETSEFLVIGTNRDGCASTSSTCS